MNFAFLSDRRAIKSADLSWFIFGFGKIPESIFDQAVGGALYDAFRRAKTTFDKLGAIVKIK